MLSFKMKQACPLGALFAVVAAVPLAAQVPPSAFVNFEGALTNPVRISADGTRLFAVNTPDARLSVFDLTSPASPKLLVEIPVGIEPVSVNINPGVSGNDEAWVVNEESDSVSVVSVSKGIVTDTIYCKNEPSDVVFGKGKAFVSASRLNQVNVYDAASHTLLKTIPLTGSNPRALAVGADGAAVYVAFALSGNHTTIIPDNIAPPPPPPINPALPPAPQVGLIVDADNPSFGKIPYTMPDNDVAAISTTTLKVTKYFPHLGTENLGLTVNPKTGMVYVANVDALNLIMFETALNGHIVNNQISSVDPATGAANIYDLNPGIDYGQLPNPAALQTALGMPTGIVFEPSGRYLYIAAFGTDRIGIFDTSANPPAVSSFIEIDPQATGATVNPASKRGPRGLALNGSANLLYVLNRISNTISIVNLASNTVTAEIPTGAFDPTPAVIRSGRGFLYDHKLSGNGTAGCASCHIDSELDLLAWNLGDPTGDMTSLQQGTETFTFHPMKGPMTTQTLRGLVNTEPYHWRGDKPNFAAFNGAFAALLGGSQLSDPDMAAFSNFINTVAYMPNPNQNLDRSLPKSVPLPDVPGVSASPAVGENLFLNVSDTNQTCNTCHTYPGTGTNQLLKISGNHNPLIKQPLKTAQLRELYQKTAVNFNPGGVSINGFGFIHNGQDTGLVSFFGDRFPVFAHKPKEQQAIEAFELCFDTGTAPAVGYSRTLNAANATGAPQQSDWTTLESRASKGDIDLIANGTIQGQIHGLLYLPATNNYETDTTGLGPFTRAQLQAFIVAEDTLTLMGVPPGSGLRMGIERRLNGVLNGDAANKLAKLK
jgi:YVTN family beta-propeller protein